MKMDYLDAEKARTSQVGVVLLTHRTTRTLIGLDWRAVVSSTSNKSCQPSSGACYQTQE